MRARTRLLLVASIVGLALASGGMFVAFARHPLAARCRAIGGFPRVPSAIVVPTNLDKVSPGVRKDGTDTAPIDWAATYRATFAEGWHEYLALVARGNADTDVPPSESSPMQEWAMSPPARRAGFLACRAQVLGDHVAPVKINRAE